MSTYNDIGIGKELPLQKGLPHIPDGVGSFHSRLGWESPICLSLREIMPLPMHSRRDGSVLEISGCSVDLHYSGRKTSEEGDKFESELSNIELMSAKADKEV